MWKGKSDGSKATLRQQVSHFYIVSDCVQPQALGAWQGDRILNVQQ